MNVDARTPAVLPRSKHGFSSRAQIAAWVTEHSSARWAKT